jgi:two-component system cell cycle response regulator
MSGRILAVDDDPLNLKLVEAALVKDGYEIITAGDGVTALKMVEEFHPDIVLLDVMMPEMDGFEVCSQLRKKPTTARIPVMMLTALNSVEERIRGSMPARKTIYQNLLPLPNYRHGSRSFSVGLLRFRLKKKS